MKPKMLYDENKFKDFTKMLRDSKAAGVEVVLVHNPQALGDNYEELVENLNRLADAGLGLRIVPRTER